KLTNPSTFFGDQGQHTRVGEQVIGTSERSKLVAAEHSDQGKIPQRLADVRRVDAGHAIKRAATRAAVKVKAKGRFFAGEFLCLPLEHLIQIFPRSLAVTQSEDHRLAFPNFFTDSYYAFSRIQADDVAHQILTRADRVLIRVCQ